ncbi:hypothetical protein Mapa_015733 [Marchantia paleacea]|nr:hypothetical protein Mapa_015733 [Marchantia paleacea]
MCHCLGFRHSRSPRELLEARRLSPSAPVRCPFLYMLIRSSHQGVGETRAVLLTLGPFALLSLSFLRASSAPSPEFLVPV